MTQSKIINDDCFSALSYIEEKSISLILIDPPYLISKDSNFKKNSDMAPENLIQKYKISIDFGEWDKEELDWEYLFKEYNRILKKGGTLIIFYDIWKSSEIKRLSEKFNFKQPRVGAWIKNNPVPINSNKNYLSNAAEYFFTFVKGGKPTFNSKYDNAFYYYPICHGRERYNHPTQKPLNLIKDLINKHSNPGDIVLDTFAGTGTTGHASILLNRNYILIEKDITYFNIIKERLSSINNI